MLEISRTTDRLSPEIVIEFHNISNSLRSFTIDRDIRGSFLIERITKDAQGY